MIELKGTARDCDLMQRARFLAWFESQKATGRTPRRVKAKCCGLLFWKFIGHTRVIDCPVPLPIKPS